MPSNIEKTHWYSRRDLGVLLVCAVVLGTLLVLGIKGARMSAHRMESANDLKQLGLAVHDYESAFGRLPSGADVDETGQARHGWFTRISPFVEASSWPNHVDKTVAWDHPFNAHLFLEKRLTVLREGVSLNYTAEGFGLTHTMGNPNILNSGGGVRLADLKSGLSHSWLFGEVVGDFQPWGYPYNWRALKWPLNADSSSYGGWHDGAQFCFADGSVDFISKNVDRSVLEELANAPPIAAERETAVPLRSFACAGDYAAREHLFFESVPTQATKGSIGTEIILDASGKAEIAALRFNKRHMKKIGLGLDSVIERYPTLRVIVVGELDDTDAAKVAKLRELQTLVVSNLNLTEGGVQALQSITTLRHLSYSNATSLPIVSKALTHCEIHQRTR